MNTKEKIEDFNHRRIHAYDVFQKEMNTLKEELFNEVLNKAKITKEDFVNLPFEEAYSLLSKAHKNVSASTFPKQFLDIGDLRIFYVRDRFFKISVYNILDFELYNEDMDESIENFIDGFRG